MKLKNVLSRYPEIFFRAQLVRARIFRVLAWIVPDTVYLHAQYMLSVGRPLRLRRPLLFNEKVQWLKLNYRNPVLHSVVDKWSVREYVRGKGLAELLVPSLGVFDSFDDIPFDELPDSFVLKLTNGSGYNIICFDKDRFDLDAARRRFDRWARIDIFAAKREWAYRGVRNRIVVEQRLVAPGGGVPEDIRFFCFDGVVRLIAVDLDSVVGGRKTSQYYRHTFYPDWRPADVVIEYPRRPGYEPPRPELLPRMIEIAERLAQDFPAVRVDLYVAGSLIYFGELTFYHASGYQRIRPRSFELRMGDWLDLSPLES